MLGNQISLTNNVAKQVISVTATQDQTDFTVEGGYRINQLGVYRNGVRQVDGRDYIARNGSTVTLLSQGANAGDAMEFVVFDDFRVADALSVNTGGTVNASVNITGALQLGTGTSIFSPAENELTLGTNSAERVRVSAGGSVGIGTDNPITNLMILGRESRAGEGLVRIRNDHTTTGQPAWGLGITRQASGVRALLLGSDDNNNAAICVNGNNSLIFGEEVSGTWTEHMRINSAGLVGINDTSPGHLLSVKDGDIASMKNASASGGNAVNMMRFRVENSSDTSQKATLGGISAETVSSWGGSLTFHTKTANGTPNDTVTERMRIDNGGDVGINTANPTARLHLNIGADQTWAQIDKSRAANEPMLQLIHSAGNRHAKIRFANADGSWSVGIDASENLVIKSGETSTGGSGTVRARFTTDGLCFGDDTAAANALDDYEEGTWTPTFVNGTWTYDTQSGRYTKIGNLVCLSGFIMWSAVSGTGNLQVNIPFTSTGSNGTDRYVGSFGYVKGVDLGGTRQLTNTVTGGQSVIGLYLLSDNVAPSTTLVQNTSSTGELQFTITLQVQ